MGEPMTTTNADRTPDYLWQKGGVRRLYDAEWNVYLEVGQKSTNPCKPVHTVTNPDAEDEANARLTLSAPALLAACRLAADHWESGDVSAQRAYDALCDAVLQATGMLP
jgi:hypothetical protein